MWSFTENKVYADQKNRHLLLPSNPAVICQLFLQIHYTFNRKHNWQNKISLKRETKVPFWQSNGIHLFPIYGHVAWLQVFGKRSKPKLSHNLKSYTYIHVGIHAVFLFLISIIISSSSRFCTLLLHYDIT